MWRFLVSITFFLGLLSTLSAQETPLIKPVALDYTKFYRQKADAAVFVTGKFVDPRGKTPQHAFVKPPKGSGGADSVGSGVIFRPEGYILTNAHAVMTTVTPVIELRDGTRHRAEVIAVFQANDLALLKIKGDKPFTYVPLAEDDTVQVCMPVLLIGNPNRLLFTCAAGIVSATGRRSDLSDQPGVVLNNLLQTDAAVNPGSSGGPWIDPQGRITAITVSRQGDAENIGFGIPAATIRSLLPKMLLTEQRRGFSVGVRVAQSGSCQITEVVKDSPAAKAGLRVGEVIKKIGNDEIRSMIDYYFALQKRSPGDKIDFFIAQGGDAKLAKKQLTLTATPAAQKATFENVQTWLGCKLDELNLEQIEKFNLRDPQCGFIVTEITNKSAFKKVKNEEHRLRAGDVLVSVGGQRPVTREHFAEIFARHRDTPTNLVLLRKESDEKPLLQILIRGF